MHRMRGSCSCDRQQRRQARAKQPTRHAARCCCYSSRGAVLGRTAASRFPSVAAAAAAADTAGWHRLCAVHLLPAAIVIVTVIGLCLSGILLGQAQGQLVVLLLLQGSR